MDHFYRKTNIEIFKKWVYFQVMHDSRLTLVQYDERTYQIFYQDKVARFVVWPIGIIEEAIMQGEQLLFYLHYQFYNFHYATDLFYRMIEKLTEKEKTSQKILLCCSGGMTTGYFAQRLHRYCQLNHLPYEFEATAIYNLEKVYHQYCLILLAPQLRFKRNELSEKCRPIPVEDIEASVFATYDCHAMIEHIERFLKNGGKHERKKENA